MSQRISKILVANRGEIACRVIRTAKDEGYKTVAVCSHVDAQGRHVDLADESVCIGESPASASYLDAGKILAAAKQTGADAIHPGYGFLSENADFAQCCADAGITFIGPPPKAIRIMGDKAESKRLMRDSSVPCVPGYEGEAQDDATLKAEVKQIGFPVLLKAAAGGGGRGMRTVRSADELDDALSMARSEAMSAFGSDTLIVEKLVENARHVEIQVLADTHGNCVHLGERDCSVQRRHQKIVEESPCPIMTDELRAAMGEAAVNAAKAVDYTNAGTVEFLLTDDGDFYFLEMNTRLQVEHPVTEMVTGLDLVALQIAVAQGEVLPLTQPDVSLKGHAIEVRLYAEDPEQDFAPQIGTVHTWQPAEGAGIRVDHGLKSTAEVSPFYDAMVAKIIAWGANREESRNRLLAALRNSLLLGVRTNVDLLRKVLEHEIFVEGQARTNFIENSGVLATTTEAPDMRRLLVAAAVFIERDAASVSPSMKGWRSTGPSTVPVKLIWKDESHDLVVSMRNAAYTLSHEDEEVSFEVESFTDGQLRMNDSGHVTEARFALDGTDLYLEYDNRIDHFCDATYLPPEDEVGASDGVLKAPMVGQVVEVNVAPGDTVEKDAVLIHMEAMKMVNHITAPFDAKVESVNVAVGDQVRAGDVLLQLEASASEDA